MRAKSRRSCPRSPREPDCRVDGHARLLVHEPLDASPRHADPPSQLAGTNAALSQNPPGVWWWFLRSHGPLYRPTTQKTRPGESEPLGSKPTKRVWAERHRAPGRLARPTARRAAMGTGAPRLPIKAVGERWVPQAYCRSGVGLETALSRLRTEGTVLDPAPLAALPEKFEARDEVDAQRRRFSSSNSCCNLTRSA
jgi:hypothetical protein